MTSKVITNAFILLGGYDVSGTSNSMQAEIAKDELENTVFGDDTRRYIAGLKRANFGAAGFVDLANYDAAKFNQVGGADAALSFGPEKTAGGIAYNYQVTASNYTVNAGVGELLAYDLAAMTRGNLGRGILLENVTGITSTGAGTEQQWVALSPGETLQASLHVFSVAGGTPNLELQIETDAADTFGSATTQITFDAVSGIGSQIKTVTGAITDTYYRVNRATVSGTFSYAVVITKY